MKPVPTAKLPGSGMARVITLLLLYSLSMPGHTNSQQYLMALAFPTTFARPAGIMDQVANDAHLLPWRCGRWFLSGVNVPWQNGGFGADFGTVEEWGQHTYNHAATEQMFAELKASGVNSVRWWVFADGRGAPEFDAASGGRVIGFDPDFLTSMGDAIKLAAKHDIYIVFNLWSFDMLFGDGTAYDRGEHAGGHRDLIIDASKRQSFIDNALLPMLQYPISGTNYTIGNHPNVLAWDIINEPELGIAEAGAIKTNIPEPASLTEMRRFVAEVSAAIHHNSNQLVTLGSASMKWNSEGASGAIGNWWSDAALKSYDPDGYLDFYQVHYYSWMSGNGIIWSYSPLFNTFDAAGFDKPTVIGEFPSDAAGTGHTSGEILSDIYKNGYAGAWAWSYEELSSFGSWLNSQNAYKAFNSSHPTQVNIGCYSYLPFLRSFGE